MGCGNGAKVTRIQALSLGLLLCSSSSRISPYLRPMTSFQQKMQAALSERKATGLLRKIPSPIGGRIDFCSNDYLGFARNLNVDISTGGGATGSRLISGNSPLAEALELEIATYHKAEAALLFPSGYAANIGLLPAVARRGDTIIYDKLLHASLRDGMRLSHAKTLGFAHNDLEDLARKLQLAEGQAFVVVESVYSMDGDQAPLTEMVLLCEKENALLIVDEAHGTGVLGKKGEGLVNAQGLQDRIFARVHTFGKAIGSHGAVVLGSQVLKDYLVNFARSFIYATALPEHTLLSIQAAYQAMATGKEVTQLQERIRYFLHNCSPRVRQRLVPSTTPIQAFICSGNKQVLELASVLQANNFAILAIRYPTVPQGEERIRICLHVFNTEQEIDQLLACLEQAIQNHHY